jgi:hypothetical protein
VVNEAGLSHERRRIRRIIGKALEKLAGDGTGRGENGTTLGTPNQDGADALPILFDMMIPNTIAIFVSFPYFLVFPCRSPSSTSLTATLEWLFELETKYPWYLGW